MREIFSLDGTWQVIFDHDNNGRTLEWQHRHNFTAYSEIEDVIVPACLEEYKQDYEGVAWYGRSFYLPVEFKEKAIRLSFDAVNYRAEIWVNGEAAGAHEGGYTGFELQIDDLLIPGEENFITVRVITPIITRNVVIDGLGRDEMPHWRGAIAGGIWQSVNLVITGKIYLVRSFIKGDIRSGKAECELTIHNSNLNNSTIELANEISQIKGSQVATDAETLVLRPGKNIIKRNIQVPDYQLWSLDNPVLYQLRTTIDSSRSDQLDVRFGFREFTVEGKNFMLNGEKILLKTVFSEAFYPHSLAYPRDIELLKKEFRLVKDGNINMIRPWRKPQPSIVYDMADEMGILIVGPLPVECMKRWPRITPYTGQRIMNEVTEMVLRDRNHPSIVIWEMFNEIMRPGLKRLRHATSLAARELDETRLIIDEAGGFSEPCRFYLPGSYEPSEMNDVHDYPGMPLPQKLYDNLLALGKTESEMGEQGLSLGVYTFSQIKPGLLTNISELGYGSIPDLEENLERYEREGNPITPDYRMLKRLHDSYLRIFNETGLSNIYPSFHDFMLDCQETHYTGNKLMAEACRINPDIAGIGIHSLNDGDWIFGAGLIDYFRTPKRAYYAIKEVFADLYFAIRPSAQNVYAGDEVHIKITSVNDNAEFKGRFSIRVCSPEGKEIYSSSENVNIPAGICNFSDITVSTDDLAGRCPIDLSFTSTERDTDVTNRTSFYVIEREKSTLPAVTVHVIDIDGSLSKFLNARKLNLQDFTSKAQGIALVSLSGWDGSNLPIFKELADWVERGGRAVILGAPPEEAMITDPRWGGEWRFMEEDTLFPFPVSFCYGKTLWTPANHVIREHPVYDGLPSNCQMGQEYRDVYPHWSLATPSGDWISCNITYGFYRDVNKRNYLGVTDLRNAANLMVKSHGSGDYVISTHRIVENLGHDPLAERLFANLLRWAVSNEDNSD